jgi:hypothetical protein
LWQPERLGIGPIRAHIGGMQIQCPKCTVIVAIGSTKWFFDGGECEELKGTEAGAAKAYEKCPTLRGAVSEAEKYGIAKAPLRPKPAR